MANPNPDPSPDPHLSPHLEQATQRVQLSLRSSGRPIDANVELWHTPSYIPTKFRIYTENGESRPVDAIIETPKHPKTVAVYNTGSLAPPHVERLGRGRGCWVLGAGCWLGGKYGLPAGRRVAPRSGGGRPRTVLAHGARLRCWPARLGHPSTVARRQSPAYPYP